MTIFVSYFVIIYEHTMEVEPMDIIDIEVQETIFRGKTIFPVD
ncbi:MULTISPECIES: hypothetical protein [Moorena]|uniref:Uncharacterized protein n=2 Tax=Moorena producens TaxID=1155739 RepID=A0A9Q9ST73_MOOP1|nr:MULTISPECIES: hypothetical protein [Moorena]EGJ33752.1 hypothetical protein LYNGBM3L_25500 [Moorena producens 3L]WAN69167.1 hypothetical protein BJP36_43190 [Moorena producens JHB]